MKVLSMLLMLLLLSTPSASFGLRGKNHRKFLKKFFPATADSVRLENERADALSLARVDDEQDLLALVQHNVLVPLVGVEVSRRLPQNRRYALPATVEYVRSLNEDYIRVSGHSLVVSSAVRPVTTQRRLRRWNRCAAPAYGNRSSSHERGSTVDISRHFSRQEYLWLVWRLWYDKARGKILVIEERACFHIFVGESDEVYNDAGGN